MFRSLAGASLLGFLVLVAPPAQAADVTFWACHGPERTALGAAPITTTGTVAGSCDAPDTTLSAESLRMTAPADIVWVSLERSARGPGYAATAGEELERAGAGEELTGVFGSSARGRELVLAGGTIQLHSAALTVRDATAPTAEIKGLPSRASGTLSLPVQAADTGVGLAKAEAFIDATLAADAAYGVCAELSPDDLTIDRALGADCPATGTETLAIDTTRYANGEHELLIRVTDAAGNKQDVLWTLKVDNAIATATPSPTPDETVTPEETATPTPTPIVQAPHTRTPTPTPTPTPTGEIGILGDQAARYTTRDFLSIPKRPRVSKRGTLTLTARCPLDKTCSLRVKLTRAGRTLASGRVTVKSKKTAKLTLKLKPSAVPKRPQAVRLTVAGYAGVATTLR